MKNIKEVAYGFVFGIANIIPGVSGGTMALVFGFYERLLHFLNQLGVSEVKSLLAHLFSWLRNPTNTEARKQFWSYLRQHDWFFIARLAIGALISILALSALIKFLIETHFELTYGFFFGLILLSVAVPWRLIKNRGSHQWFFLILGAVLTVGLTLAVNPIDKTKSKSETYKERYLAQENIDVSDVTPPTAFSYNQKYTTTEFALIAFAGMLAVSAMVLPGISGSLILLLLGQYVAVITAISNLKSLLLDEILFLGVFGLGMIFGLLITARLVEFALKKAHDATMAFLTGLIIGSLFTLWPFKKTETLDLYIKQDNGTIILEQGSTQYSNINIFPDTFVTWWPVLITMTLGALCMLFFLKNDPDFQKA